MFDFTVKASSNERNEDYVFPQNSIFTLAYLRLGAAFRFLVAVSPSLRVLFSDFLVALSMPSDDQFSLLPAF